MVRILAIKEGVGKKPPREAGAGGAGSAVGDQAFGEGNSERVAVEREDSEERKAAENIDGLNPSAGRGKHGQRQCTKG